MSLEQHLSNEQLTAIAAEYGTPVYVYNADKITTQYQQLTTAFAGQQVRFFYACKALTNPHILRHVHSMGAGIDVSDKLFTGVEIIKEENQPVDVQAAIHYAFLPQFFVRGGVATQTSNYFAAVGFQLPAFRIDISGSYHQQLGWSPGILLLAKFGKNKSAESAINP